MSIEAIADAFFQAIENGDTDTLNRLYADDAGIWHNFDNVTQTKEEGVQTLAQFAALAESRYVVHQRYVVGDTLIQRHHINIRMKDSGATKTVQVAIFMAIRDGQVHQIYEYLDGSDVVAEAFEGVGGTADA